MKLEYLNNTGDSLYNKIIRLYGFNQSETLALADVIRHKLMEDHEAVVLNKLNFIDPVNCELTLTLSPNNRGIIPLNDNKFVCEMNLESYSNVIAMLEDSVSSTGYYWLDNDCSEIDLLYSEGGGW